MNDIREIAKITIRIFLKICWKFHIACAEMAQADVLLSTDDRLLRNASRHQGVIGIVVDNPVTWLMNV